jgi:lipopolysaccharide transport system permease protein
LFIFLAWRDILVRYKQTVIGIAWALIRPLATLVVFTFVFGRVAKLPTAGRAPYALMVFAGLLPWQFFSNALSEAGNSLISNSNLVSKVYFPRLIVPASSIVTSMVDFCLSIVFLAALMVWYQFVPQWQILLLPLFVLLDVAAVAGASLWLAALNVEYRDLRIVIPFIVQFGLFISPVGFSSKAVPQKWQLLYSLNPMVGIIDGFRWSLLRGETALDWMSLAVSGAFTVLIMVTGVWYFRRTERTLADVI